MGAIDDEYTRHVVFFAVALPEVFSEDLVRAHVAHPKRLEDEGRLELAGPFSDRNGGMLVLRNVSAEKARPIAQKFGVAAFSIGSVGGTIAGACTVVFGAPGWITLACLAAAGAGAIAIVSARIAASRTPDRG